MAEGAVVHLPRGGVVVTTAAGPIQFGCPPETIKDHMALGQPVPTIYVVPQVRFDRQHGVNVSEVEFPAYFNFFVLKKSVTLITDGDGERRIRQILTETLFGPQTYYSSDEEYDSRVPAAARANHRVECAQFKRNPYDPSLPLDVDTLLKFTVFDDAHTVRLEPGVEIERLPDEEGYVVREGGAEVARVAARVVLPQRVPPPSLPPSFEPPAFGVTVLGSSHGFDPKGKTTGFILWMNHRGLLVDPPMGSGDLLGASGIAPKLIDGIVLTHCHADHDSGTFQKILEEGRIVVYTSAVIIGSFLRKYSALSGLDEDFLRRTFVFRPARIGTAVPVHGGELRFFHSLHSIPTVGFEAYYGGKSLVFSGDTLYDPERIEQMVVDGHLTRERADALIYFPWHHTVVLHEAGVPPLHTPTEVLAALPAAVKERLYLLHIAAKDLPEGKGLKVAPAGVENTLRIEVEPPEHADAIELLDVFAAIDLFRDFSLTRAREILQVAKRRSVPTGTKVIERGTPGDAFYIIVSGTASVVVDGQEIKRYQASDYFGETALILRQPRNADVVALTDLGLVQIDRYDFLYLLRGTDIPNRLVRLATMRQERSWELFAKNSTLAQLTSGQKTQLQSYLEVFETQAGQELWSSDSPAEAAFVVDAGAVTLEGYGADLHPFGPGSFLGEVDAIVAGETTRGAARVTEAGRVFKLRRADLIRWFDENPGIQLAFLGTRAVE